MGKNPGTIFVAVSVSKTIMKDFLRDFINFQKKRTRNCRKDWKGYFLEGPRRTHVDMFWEILIRIYCIISESLREPKACDIITKVMPGAISRLKLEEVLEETLKIFMKG